MKPQVGDLRTVTQRFDGKEWVLCLQSMPPKELSDDEILDLWVKKNNLNGAQDIVDFARAILKKASEK